jgi:A/G-specific adenine glycosylase
MQPNHRMEPQTLSDAGQRRAFRARLLRWFDGQQRALPWRGTRDPYRVWVSEIMLQQTRASVVRERYPEFLRRFPTVRKLGRARPDSVLAAWSGLGYYRRARALQATAREIVRRHGGRFPASAEALHKLPGIGRYTAAAMASIAFGEACAVVDGNVERVLRRLAGNPNGAARELWQQAGKLLSRRRPGDFNQAMMELGATVCLPAEPRCEQCPVRNWCATRGPLEKPRAPARRRQRVAYVLATRAGQVYLVRRPASDSLMPGMWELPLADDRASGGSAAEARFRHAITKTDYEVGVVRAAARPARGQAVPLSRLARLPLTGLARKILRRFQLL